MTDVDKACVSWSDWKWRINYWIWIRHRLRQKS